ncbi:MAG: DKNYY domain-containing protein [Sebaldella sp.]|nr:DKNYY domain-containing protein [Sebaldella sp.]
MKKLLLFIVLSIALFSEYKIGNIEDKAVYFEDILLKEADFNTFKVIERDSDYGKDKRNVYYRGIKIKGVNPSYFTYISRGTIESLYFKDNKNVYYEGERIKEVDFKSFKIIGSSYAVDKNNVYYVGRKINEADRKTFKISTCELVDEHEGCPYAEDKINYYKFGEVVEKK